MNNFTNNSAIIEGGALKYISKRPTAININFYSANSAKYGNNIASYPIRIHLFNATTVFPYNMMFILPNEVSNSQVSQSF